MMSTMWPALLGVPILALCLWACVIGLRAARTRKLALIGLVPAGCSLGAFVWSTMAPDVDLALRVASGAAAIAAGLAHGIWFSLVALPARRVWLRIVFVPLGMWCGTFASLWLVVPYENASLRLWVAALGAATLCAWLALPFLARDEGFVLSGSRRIPSVRFPCPRCGTRVDWGQGIAACTDCGLFLHIDWPAAGEAEPERAETGRPRRSVRFACPRCRAVAQWERGRSACRACGLDLALHWNEHPGGRSS